VKFFASRVYDGMLTQKVRESFLNLTKKAASQYINDQVNERLKSAITGIPPALIDAPNESSHVEEDDHKDETDVVTTLEELEGYHIVKAITRAVLEAPRITHRDNKSYFGILVDDNNRKPLCRLHFNRTQKYIGLFDIEKNETRHPIATVDDIYSFADILKATAALYN
jgi:hypothetical protein